MRSFRAPLLRLTARHLASHPRNPQQHGAHHRLRRLRLLPVGLALVAGLLVTTPVANSSPLPPPSQEDIVTPYRPPADRYSAGHRGVDIAWPTAALVPAIRAGVVSFVGQVGGVDNVSITHPDGTRTTYQPITPIVKEGSAVIAGEPIGTVGPGHCARLSCFHLGWKFGDNYLDPTALLPTASKLPIRLLPANARPRLSSYSKASSSALPVRPTSISYGENSNPLPVRNLVPGLASNVSIPTITSVTDKQFGYRVSRTSGATLR